MGTIYNDEMIPSSVLHNALAFGTTVKGDITTDGDFRLDGRLEGTISCGGKIVIGETAEVEGDIISVNAEIFGRVTGSITTSEVLVLKPTAIIKGIISTQALVVEPSAKFSGTCNMTLESEDNEINPGNDMFSETIPPMPAMSAMSAMSAMPVTPLTEGYAAMGNINDDELFK